MTGRRAGATATRHARAGVPPWCARAVALTLLVVLAAPAATAKRVIGAVETLREGESGLTFAARIDTGAATTSIHALDVAVDHPSQDPSAHVGAPVAFTIANERGERARLRGVIAEVVRVKTSEGAERRYKVHLTLTHDELDKRVLVSLNDRSHLRYKLLVGRNFLRGDFVVDVSLNDADD